MKRKRRRKGSSNAIALNFEEVCKSINNIVDKLSSTITKYDSYSLVHRAFWSSAYLHLQPQISEPSESDKILALRTLEFIQNYIASISPISENLPPIDDEHWKEIENLVKEYNNHMVPFLISKSNEDKESAFPYDLKRDEIITEDLLHWWMVRGNRYHVHQIKHIRELLAPHKIIFESTLNYPLDKFISELEKIQYSLTFGVGDAFNNLATFQEETLNQIENSTLGISDHEDDSDWFANAIDKLGLRKSADEIFDQAFGLSICNLTKITSLPTKLLDELSWEEGQDKEFWAEGQYAGWNLRVTPLRKRPFLKIQGQYYCFDMNNLFDNLYRGIEKLILLKRPDYREMWNKSQKEISEILPFQYLARLLPTAEIYRSVYFGKLGGRTEIDGLVIYDDVMLIIEVKAGALGIESPAMDYETHLKKLQELIGNPAKQANRFSEHLRSSKSIEIYDGNSKASNVITTLKIESFREIFQCSITLDNLSHLAAKANKLKAVGIDTYTSSNWSIALDDLRVYSDIFESPTQFLHFLEQRKLATSSKLIDFNDELDHLGIYLLKNNYALTAEELIKEKQKNDFIMWDSFTHEIDEYYSNLLADPNTNHPKPKQSMPHQIQEIINLLDNQEKSGRAKVASRILNGSQEYREQIVNGISHILSRQQETGRVIPIHIYGDMNISIFCQQNGIALPNKEWIAEYTISILKQLQKDSALVLILEYEGSSKLIDVDFLFV